MYWTGTFLAAYFAFGEARNPGLCRRAQTPRSLTSFGMTKATKAQSNEAGKQRSRKATKPESNEAGEQRSRKATKPESNEAPKQRSRKATKPESNEAAHYLDGRVQRT